jgi:hypothetical protein
VESTTILEPTVCIFNIPFEVGKEGGEILLENHNWPILTVCGKSLPEALENLRSLIKSIIREYVFVSEGELAEDAI